MCDLVEPVRECLTNSPSSVVHDILKMVAILRDTNVQIWINVHLLLFIMSIK